MEGKAMAADFSFGAQVYSKPLYASSRPNRRTMGKLNTLRLKSVPSRAASNPWRRQPHAMTGKPEAEFEHALGGRYAHNRLAGFAA
jgi:hypothetical protein